MAQRGTFARRATRMGGPILLGPLLLGPFLLGPFLLGPIPLGPIFLGATLTRRSYVDFGYLASAACRG